MELFLKFKLYLRQTELLEKTDHLYKNGFGIK